MAYQELYLKSSQEAIRRHQRTHNFTSKEVADRTGVEKVTVDKWRTGTSSPHGGNLIAVAKLYGPDFLNDLFRPFGFGGVCEIEGADHNPFMVNATVGDLISELSTALQDGRICHVEAPEVKKQLISTINCCTALLSELEGRE